MSVMLEAALRYAALGWFIFPLHSIRFDGKCECGKPECTSPGKHPRIKWKEGATCDRVEVEKLCRKWPNAGIGLATGPSGLIVFDIDGLKGVMTFKELCNSGGIVTPITARARTARGAHVFFRGQSPTFSDTETKLDVRSVGGYVVLAPSPHVSGHVYRWEVEPDPSRASGGIAECPAPLLAYASDSSTRAQRRRAAGGQGVGGMSGAPQGGGPALSPIAEDSFTTRLGASLEAPDWFEVDRALACIPADCSMDKWIKVGMALHAARDPSGWERWDRWSERGGEKYKGSGEIAYKWTTFKHDVGGVGIGTLFGFAKELGWSFDKRSSGREEVMPIGVRHNESPETRPPLEENEAGAAPFMNGHSFDKRSGGPALPASFRESTSTNPLILLNEKYAVIGDVGGKCLVLSWTSSPIDPGVKVPSFQSFKAFSERYAHQYITVKKVKHLKDGDEEYEDDVQLGQHWLKWHGRRTYEGIELAPNQPMVLPNHNYNLWQGWGCLPIAGPFDKGSGWPLMRSHVEDVLASGDRAASEYILRWAAWAVQNPDKPAKVALVLRGGKGAGKGAFLTTLRALFGAHGMQIYNRAHLVGSFNAHLRNCLFLFADEAFWAGDKQGESTLKGLITEPVIVLEQKGVDAVAWPNRLKVAMAANASWVVPASADERRYAVFDVSDQRKQDLTYFGALHAELASGGLGAMLHDLLTMNLGGWSPMQVPQTRALQDQKDKSLSPLMEWWEDMLQGANSTWFETTHMRDTLGSKREWSGKVLMEGARGASPALQRYSDKAIAKFLKTHGAAKRHTETGTKWVLPTLDAARTSFEREYGVWTWDVPLTDWNNK